MIVYPNDARLVDWVLELSQPDLLLEKIYQGHAFRVEHPVTGLPWGSVDHSDNVWGLPATQLKTTGGNATTFVVCADENTYNNADGWVTLKNAVTKTIVRHAGWIMWEMAPGTGPNYDFSYKIQSAGNGLYRILNPFQNNVVVGFDAAADRVEIVSPTDANVVAWKLVLV